MPAGMGPSGPKCLAKHGRTAADDCDLFIIVEIIPDMD